MCRLRNSKMSVIKASEAVSTTKCLTKVLSDDCKLTNLLMQITHWTYLLTYAEVTLYRVHSKLKGQNSRTFQGLLKDLKFQFSSTNESFQQNFKVQKLQNMERSHSRTFQGLSRTYSVFMDFQGPGFFCQNSTTFKDFSRTLWTLSLGADRNTISTTCQLRYAQ